MRCCARHYPPRHIQIPGTTNPTNPTIRPHRRHPRSKTAIRTWNPSRRTTNVTVPPWMFQYIQSVHLPSTIPLPELSSTPKPENLVIYWSYPSREPSYSTSAIPSLLASGTYIPPTPLAQLALLRHWFLFQGHNLLQSFLLALHRYKWSVEYSSSPSLSRHTDRLCASSFSGVSSINPSSA